MHTRRDAFYEDTDSSETSASSASSSSSDDVVEHCHDRKVVTAYNKQRPDKLQHPQRCDAAIGDVVWDPRDKLSHRKKRSSMLLVDSRDRNVATYPSANRFDVFMGIKMKGLISVELVQAIIPLLPGFTERYVVICEDVCLEDAIMFADRVPFGVTTNKGGCTFPRGCIGCIPLIPAYTGANYALWESSNVSKYTKSKMKAALSNVERFSFSLWCWNIVGTAMRYPLPNEPPPPGIPDVSMNIQFVCKLNYR